MGLFRKMLPQTPGLAGLIWRKSGLPINTFICLGKLASGLCSVTIKKSGVGCFQNGIMPRCSQYQRHLVWNCLCLLRATATVMTRQTYHTRLLRQNYRVVLFCTRIVEIKKEVWWWLPGREDSFMTTTSFFTAYRNGRASLCLLYWMCSVLGTWVANMYRGVSRNGHYRPAQAFPLNVTRSTFAEVVA